jgi:hypothetical protein
VDDHFCYGDYSNVAEGMGMRYDMDMKTITTECLFSVGESNSHCCSPFASNSFLSFNSRHCFLELAGSSLFAGRLQHSSTDEKSLNSHCQMAFTYLAFSPFAQRWIVLVPLHFRLAGNKSGYSDIGLYLGTAGAESLTAILDGGISILEHQGLRHYW